MSIGHLHDCHKLKRTDDNRVYSLSRARIILCNSWRRPSTSSHHKYIVSMKDVNKAFKPELVVASCSAKSGMASRWSAQYRQLYFIGRLMALSRAALESQSLREYRGRSQMFFGFLRYWSLIRLKHCLATCRWYWLGLIRKRESSQR